MRKTYYFIAAALLTAVACSAGGVGPSYNGAGGAGGASGSDGAGKAGSSSAEGGAKGDGGKAGSSEQGGSGAEAGGSAGPGGSGQGAGSSGTAGAGGSGSGDLDGGAFGGAGGGVNVTGGSGGSPTVDDACAAVAQAATPKLQPADIVWFIDTSGSMSEETTSVQQKLNAFAGGIFSLGIDVHVVMVAEELTCPPFFGCSNPLLVEGICIPSPLGSGSCPKDSNLPFFLHDTTTVNSTDGMLVMLKTYPTWKSMLRAEATKTLIVVTDDDATSPPYDKSSFPDGAKGAAKKFIDDFTALDPVMLKGWKLNGIYSFTGCPSAANVGETWASAVEQTGGVKGDLCNQDFQPVFNDMAKAIVQGSKPLDCQWKIPAPPMGQDLNTGKINVKYTSGGGQETDLLYVDGQGQCDPQKGGWYFDNNAKPGEIYACPASCQLLQADKSGKVDILFGCDRKALDPK